MMSFFLSAENGFARRIPAVDEKGAREDIVRFSNATYIPAKLLDEELNIIGSTVTGIDKTQYKFRSA